MNHKAQTWKPGMPADPVRPRHHKPRMYVSNYVPDDPTSDRVKQSLSVLAKSCNIVATDLWDYIRPSIRGLFGCSVYTQRPDGKQVYDRRMFTKAQWEVLNQEQEEAKAEQMRTQAARRAEADRVSREKAEACRKAQEVKLEAERAEATRVRKEQRLRAAQEVYIREYGDTLELLKQQVPYREIARRLGVSDTAIRKRRDKAKALGLL